MTEGHTDTVLGWNCDYSINGACQSGTPLRQPTVCDTRTVDISTAAIFRMLSNPTARPNTIAPDFSNLVVVTAQTGDEWSTTGRLVHIGNLGYQNLSSFM